MSLLNTINRKSHTREGEKGLAAVCSHTDSAGVENEVEMGKDDCNASNEEPGIRSQLTGSLLEVIYTPKTASAKGGDLIGASNAYGSEYGWRMRHWTCLPRRQT